MDFHEQTINDVSSLFSWCPRLSFIVIWYACCSNFVCLCFCSKELSEELQQLQEMARKFSREEIVPVAAHYDKTGEVRRYLFT